MPVAAPIRSPNSLPFIATSILRPSRTSYASAPVRPSTSTDYYVRVQGSDLNGGSSPGLAPERTGTDGVTNGTTTFTSASANFTAADVNKLINIIGKARYRIVGYTNSTTVTLSGSPTAGSILTWNIGGAVQSLSSLLLVVNSPAGTILGGDRIWVGAGTYRETISLTLTSPTFELQINGDVDGAMTGDPGMVILTAYTTNDRSLPAAASTLTIGARRFITFQNMVIIGGDASPSCLSLSTSDFTLRRCVVIGSRAASTVSGTPNTNILPSNLILDSCVFFTFGSPSNVSLTLSRPINGPDFDNNIVVKNCVIFGLHNSACLVFSATGIGGNPGGVNVHNCFMFGGNMSVQASNLSTVYPMYVWNSVLVGNVLVVAGVQGQIVEDYNVLAGSAAPRTLVAPGPHSVASGANGVLPMALMLSMFQEVFAGMALRPFFSPMAGSPLLDFGLGSVGVSDDIFGVPRLGDVSQFTVGPFERGNAFTKETVVTHTGANSISLVGAGYHDFDLPVDATQTNVSIYTRFDANYRGPKPQIQLLPNNEIGLTSLVDGAEGLPDAWEQLILPPFTPTAPGVATVRVISNDTSGVGKTYFDTVAVA